MHLCLRYIHTSGFPPVCPYPVLTFFCMRVRLCCFKKLVVLVVYRNRDCVFPSAAARNLPCSSCIKTVAVSFLKQVGVPKVKIRVENSSIAGEGNNILLDPIDFLRGFSVLKDELVSEPRRDKRSFSR